MSLNSPASCINTVNSRPGMPGGPSHSTSQIQRIPRTEAAKFDLTLPVCVPRLWRLNAKSLILRCIRPRLGLRKHSNSAPKLASLSRAPSRQCSASAPCVPACSPRATSTSSRAATTHCLSSSHSSSKATRLSSNEQSTYGRAARTTMTSVASSSSSNPIRRSSTLSTSTSSRSRRHAIARPSCGSTTTVTSIPTAICSPSTRRVSLAHGPRQNAPGGHESCSSRSHRAGR